jgi:hypothetical protein
LGQHQHSSGSVGEAFEHVTASISSFEGSLQGGSAVGAAPPAGSVPSTPAIRRRGPPLSPATDVAYRYPPVNATDALDLPLVDEDLQRLEVLLESSVTTGDGFLDDVTTHLIGAGGKRLRPALALAAATGGRRSARTEDLLGAVAVELVHLASLNHDDVID